MFYCFDKMCFGFTAVLDVEVFSAWCHTFHGCFDKLCTLGRRLRCRVLGLIRRRRCLRSSNIRS